MLFSVDEIDHVPFVNAEAGLAGRDVRHDPQRVAGGFFKWRLPLLNLPQLFILRRHLRD